MALAPICKVRIHSGNKYQGWVNFCYSQLNFFKVVQFQKRRHLFSPFHFFMTSNLECQSPLAVRNRRPHNYSLFTYCRSTCPPGFLQQEGSRTPFQKLLSTLYLAATSSKNILIIGGGCGNTLCCKQVLLNNRAFKLYHFCFCTIYPWFSRYQAKSMYIRGFTKFGIKVL